MQWNTCIADRFSQRSAIALQLQSMSKNQKLFETHTCQIFCISEEKTDQAYCLFLNSKIKII